ncbi:MAG: hybrid sensor histidine kinase/response regulator [Nitrospirae bacterium]|nr:MAG: hybrid sensor histidine kinase/response regulator [Nitrospirota bacterium]
MNEENNLKILIVEDSTTQALQLQHTLERSGYQVTAAVNGKEALILLEEGLRPTLVISDVLMPEMNGYEFCARLRADERFRELPFVLVTTLNDPKDVIRGLECGANNFIVKPYDEKYLINRIQYLFANFELRKNTKAEMGINVFFSGENYFITAERLQILDLLLSTYENAYRQNMELQNAQNDLRTLNERLEEAVRKRTRELVDANRRLNLELEERRQTEVSLERLKDQYGMLLQAAGEGIIGEDLQGRITFVNPAAENMFGYSAGELIGQSGHKTWHHSKIDGGPYPEDECPITGACRDGRTYKGTDEVFWKKDGSPFPVDYIATPIREGGAINGTVVIFRDITQRKMLQEAEVARIASDSANRSKSDFLANMSHELRTPLNSILGFSEVLIDGLFGKLNEKQKEYAQDIYNSGKHLLALINDILDLSKVEAGKLELEPSSVILKDVLDAALSLFREKAMKHNLKLSLEMEPEATVQLEADERKLKQIMFNLLSNAVKFTPDGGRVHIAARLVDGPRLTARGNTGSGSEQSPVSNKSDRNFIEVSVSDTGIGIKPGDLPKLFREFTQLESAYEKRFEGTGLGLALTKRLVELHGGKIWVDSEFGTGSTFTFVIPADQGQRTAAACE